MTISLKTRLPEQINLSGFYGGELQGGRCLQITNKNNRAYVALSNYEVHALIADLQDFLSGDLEEEIA